MKNRVCITVILPLRLEWEPYYYADESIKAGDRVEVLFARRKYTGVVSRTGVIPQGTKGTILNISGISPLDPISAEELKLWRFIADYYMCTIGEVYKSAYPSFRITSEQIEAHRREREAERRAREENKMEKQRQRLETKISKLETALAKARTEATRTRYAEEMTAVRQALDALNTIEEIPITGKQDNPIDNIRLTASQDKAYGDIRRAFATKSIALLKGITGSGKTEIYTKLATETLKTRNVLYLVPEIALSRQLEDRLRRVFGDMLLVFHSGISAAGRREAASKIRDSRYIVLGTRSALFLPHRSLGLVIVDEEHDASYKQDSPSPRYNGRDTAVMLGGIHGADVLLGSATPSLESLYNCEVGRYRMIALEQRYYGSADAEVEIIDTIAERRKRGMVGNFSRKLIAHISETLERGEQVVILRGRRAYSPVVQCESCGDMPKCPHCNVSLSYHKSQERLVCHYCGHSEPFTGKCAKCGGELKPLGAGTQRIEEEAAELFPQARIARLDGDTAQNRRLEAEIIRDFGNGETDILIGTQMVSKGFDFEGLTLVAVMQADSLLGQADFRADERAAQLLDQFRGRCGRRGVKGLFVIQTSQPEHPVYQRLAAESRDFDMNLLAERRMFAYPPYSRIVGIIIRDSNLARLSKLSGMLVQRICGAFGVAPSFVAGAMDGSVGVTGPYAPVIDKVSDEYIRHIRVCMKKDARLAANKDLLGRTVAAFGKDAKYDGHIAIDVDPL